MTRRVPRSVTEAAIYYVQSTYTDYWQLAEVAPRTPGRVKRAQTPLGVYDAREVSREGCYLRLISIVEAYVDTVSSALLREQLPTTPELLRNILEQVDLSSSSTWQDRRDAFARFHRIQLGELPRWSELDAAIEVRNSVAHGLGQLTARQRSGTAARKIAQVGVGVADGRVAISPSSLARCRDVCIGFIRGPDGVLPESPVDNRHGAQELRRSM